VQQEHPAALPPDELLRQCVARRTRRSGPGDQHRNKVETAVVLTHALTGVQAEANERRSQAENLRMALFRLRLNLALEVRQPAAAFPSSLWQSRCRGGRIAVSHEHEDFPALLAEALDAIITHHDDVRAAADCLGCTSSQLVKLLKDEPRALANVNARRRAGGLHELK
jgi:hypothetical protein